MGISEDPGEPQDLKRLLFQAREGDAEAFCLLLEPLEARLFQQAIALCRDRGAAEDLVSETLVEGWRSLRRYDESCRLTTWLYAILLHRYQKWVRRMGSRPISLGSLPGHQASQHLEVQDRLPSADASPAAIVLQNEVSHELRQFIEALSEKHRQVILLRFFEEASLLEMATVLNCSVGTVKSRLHHALRKLRNMKIPMNLLGVGRDTGM